jgi:hypothetical protein
MESDPEKRKRARAKRLIRMREWAGFKGTKGRGDAVRLLGVKYGTYSHHENAHRAFSDADGWGYAIKFKGNPLWLLYGIGKIDTPLSNDIQSIADVDFLRLEWGMISFHGGAKAALEPFYDQGGDSSAEKDINLKFQLVACDDSMIDPANSLIGFPKGTELFFDASEVCNPGEFVLAVIFGEPVEVFRRLTVQSWNDDGSCTCALVPLNPHYATRVITTGKTGELIAPLIRHTINHRNKHR